MALRVEAAFRLETYAWALERFNLGEAHPTLVGGHKWYPDDEESAFTAQSKDELRGIGFIGGVDDKLTDLGEDVFHVMQHAEVEHFTYASIGGTPSTARTAAAGTDALLIVSTEGRISVEGIRREEMTRKLASSLPSTPPAKIHGLTADLDVIKKLMAGERLQGGHQIADAKRIHQWLELEQVNGGEMHAAIRPSYGAKQVKSANPPPSWIDADGGRALLRVDNGWASLKPASDTDVADMFTRLEKSIKA